MIYTPPLEEEVDSNAHQAVEDGGVQGISRINFTGHQYLRIIYCNDRHIAEKQNSRTGYI